MAQTDAFVSTGQDLARAEALKASSYDDVITISRNKLIVSHTELEIYAAQL